MNDLLNLYQSSETAQRLADLHQWIQPVLEELTQQLGFERAFFVLMDRQTAVIRGAVGINVPESLTTLPELWRDARGGPLAQSFQTGRPIRVDDAVRDPRVPESMRAIYSTFGLLSFAAIPLIPACGVLVVAKGSPIAEDEISTILPYAGRIVACVVERDEVHRLTQSGEEQAVEADWLWWMLNAVPDPILLTDAENRVVLHNVHAERLFFAGPDSSEGKRRAIQLNNSLLSVALGGYATDQRAALGRELTLVDPIEGTELSFEVICQQATNLRTGAQGLISVLKDVTDLRHADQQIRHSLDELQRAGEEARRERDRINLILENVANPIVVTGAEGEISLMNQPAAHLLGSRDGARTGRDTTIALANEAKLSLFLSQFGLEPAQRRHGEIQLADPESEQSLIYSVTATEVVDELGHIRAVVSVMHDLTALRELERRRVEQQLFESEKLAAVGRLAAAVAHEINNPLEAIKNALYLLVSRTDADDPDRRFLEIANRETIRVSTIIRQMLGFYRTATAMAPTDVNAVIREAIALLERQMRQRHVTIAAALDRDLPLLPASADQLKQVFLNLLLNAQEAMPEGGTIKVRTRIPDESDAEFVHAGRQLLIQVEDSGSGISEENLRQLFEPFFSTKREGKGTGLGLWVSQGIVQQHDGQIKVRSRPGRGTTFTIALPIGDTHG
ncbi:MAG: ATP-binding protein [Dehalococcoidia bacterium]